ncbi:MAG: HAD family phosphatase [Clostridia bacterium]|nr:HAD family phosphatase [Clostridia bacterium]
MIKGVIFDMDGVLFDTEAFGMDCLLGAAQEQGIPMEREHVTCSLGLNRGIFIQKCTQWFGEHDYPLMLRRWAELIFEKIEMQGMPFKKGMPQVLHDLKARGIKLGLATSNERYVVDHYFKAAGIDGLMDAIATGDQVENSKPAPDIYLEAARQLGLEPLECAGVEDSFNGIRAIRAAGMKCVMIPDLKPYIPEHAPYVDLLLTDLTQLIPSLFE